ncbi:uncharacterized protein C19orf44 homolog [Labrus bergylta]|uniref:DUF4614 domain-containing protein n=1 Tax=Labrus bergylta TaxID=56723 RepID=A0A3Q3E3P3_9LABR|nr:uncharacterized protein C19orf44 homolog isoform X2 [Labrus bergylta]
MWKRGGRSSALDRAQALLSARRESVQEPAAKTRTHTDNMGGSVLITRTAPPNTQTLLSDLSDLSSVSLAPEHEAATVGSAAAAGGTQGREGDFTRNLRPQSSLGGGGSRFLKKATQPATNSNYDPDPRYVSSSQRGSQNAALSRLAQIESRIRSRKQAQEQAGQGSKKSEEELTSDLGISPPPPPAVPSLDTAEHISAQSSLGGKRFLKNSTAAAVSSRDVRPLNDPDPGVRSRSRAAAEVFPSAKLKAKSLGVVSGVSLESDEEDMKKLLGDSLGSMENSFLIPERASFKRTVDKMSKIDFAPAASPSNAAPPRSPASPSRHSSPFRFTGQPQAHFSPSALSPSPSPPRVSPSPPGRMNSSHRRSSPVRSLSSLSGRSEVMSLEEICPVRSADGSEMSSVSSEDFKINVMTLDDLVPAYLGGPDDTPGEEREAKHSHLQQLQRLEEKETEAQQQMEEDYHSDFESGSRTDPDNSASQVSEHLQGQGDEDKVSEACERTSDSDVSHGGTDYDYSSNFSDTSCSYNPRPADHSHSASRNRTSRSSRSSVSDGSRSRRRASSGKDEAVRTPPDPLADTLPAGMPSLGPAGGRAYMYPSPVVTHTVSAEMVEALSAFNPATFALNEILKQQLTMMRRIIESNRQLHSSLVQSLEPPNYRYTTLEDTKEYIHRHRAPRLTVEEALDEVMQEMKTTTIITAEH